MLTLSPVNVELYVIMFKIYRVHFRQQFTRPEFFLSELIFLNLSMSENLF